MRGRDSTLSEAAASQALQVAIDGPAGSGKSTVGRAVAGALGCAYLDTGLMYRAITWLALGCGLGRADEPRLESLAAHTTFDLDPDGETLVVNGVPAGAALRSAEVDAAVSAVSAHPGVRLQMVHRQRELANDRCIVVVGRDIGTVVLPQAPVELWVAASPRARARRRLAEALPGSQQLTEEQMETLIAERDARDSNRAASPLRRAPDAVDIPTDDLSPKDALDRALLAVRRALGADLAREGSGRSIS